MGRLRRRLAPRPQSPSATLAARLAVLRRPQTPADALPSGVHLPYQGQGALIPALTRLLATPAGASLYLAVFAPAHGSLPLWNSRLGDQVALVSVTASGARLTAPVPGAELTDGRRVAIVGAGSRAPGQAASGYYVEVVPDGVARVVWTFANAQRKHRYVVDGQVANNVVVAPFHAPRPFLLDATWHAADGTVVPTSDSLLRRAIAARRNILRKRLIRQDSQIRYRPARQLLAAFAVFDVTSLTGVKVGGLTISHPAVSSLPLAILSLTAQVPHPGFDPQLDPNDVRQATTRAGISAWIIPGVHSLCVAEVDKPRFPPYGTRAGMACSPDVASAVSGGTGLTSGYPGGSTWHYGVLPRTTPTLTIRSGPHRHKTIRPPDGVYIYRTSR